MKPLVHIYLLRPLPLFSLLQEPSTITKVTEENVEINTKEDINDMDLHYFTTDTPSAPNTLLIGKEFEEEWDTV